MHEASLVRTLLNQVAEILLQHGGESVAEIVVEMGPLSGVEPLLVRSAFDQLSPQHDMEHAMLVIREIPLGARCRACQTEFNIERFRFRCQQCNSEDIQVISGDEFRLLNVTLNQPAERSSTL